MADLVNNDHPIQFHASFNELLDSFRNTIAAMTWLKVSVESAKKFYQPYPYIIELPCSVLPQIIKVDKSILVAVEKEGFNQSTPFFTNVLIDSYRMITIAIKDIVWNEKDFQFLRADESLKFLKHLRNACAHNGVFYFGKGRQRANTLQELPITWREKIIEENMEGAKLYMDFLKPGDLFILLSDITNLIKHSEKKCL